MSRNWGGNIEYRHPTARMPASIGELQEMLVGLDGVRIAGTGHSFNRIADGAERIDLSGLPRTAEVSPDRDTVRVAGHLRYGELATMLETRGLALHNMASLPHISVAGAVATASHGSGVAQGNLSTAVRGMTIIRADGEQIETEPAELEELAVHVGALGVVTHVVLAVEASHRMHQRVFDGMAWDHLQTNLSAVMASGRSVSVFTTWQQSVGQVWCKQQEGATPPEFPGTSAAAGDRHPIAGLDPSSCTPQLGVVGPWHERLPHFRPEFEPSSGDEIQSEWHVPFQRGPEAIEAIRALGSRLAPILLVSELRAVAADRLLLSPQFGQDTIGLHFTWRNRPDAVASAIEEIEDALASFRPRAHLGKLFSSGASGIEDVRRRRFVELCRRWDPDRTFWNPWLESTLG